MNRKLFGINSSLLNAVFRGHSHGQRAQATRRWRSSRRRIDYTPSPEALAVIENARQSNPKVSFSAAIDRLILRVSGNNTPPPSSDSWES